MLIHNQLSLFLTMATNIPTSDANVIVGTAIPHQKTYQYLVETSGGQVYQLTFNVHKQNPEQTNVSEITLFDDIQGNEMFDGLLSQLDTETGTDVQNHPDFDTSCYFSCVPAEDYDKSVNMLKGQFSIDKAFYTNEPEEARILLPQRTHYNQILELHFPDDELERYVNQLPQSTDDVRTILMIQYLTFAYGVTKARTIYDNAQAKIADEWFYRKQRQVPKHQLALVDLLRANESVIDYQGHQYVVSVQVLKDNQ